MRPARFFLPILVALPLHQVQLFAPNGANIQEEPQEIWQEIIGWPDPIHLDIVLEEDHKTVYCNGVKVEHGHEQVYSIMTISSGELHINGNPVAIPQAALKKINKPAQAKPREQALKKLHYSVGLK